MRVESLHIYPVKSCRGMDVGEATLDRLGFVGDRRYMIVDPENRFITAREYPRLVLVSTTLRESIVCLEAPGMPSLCFEPPTGNTLRSVRVWEDDCEAMDADDSAAVWFSRYLGFPVRLVHTKNEFHRLIDSTYNPGGRHVHFGDAYPLMVMSSASLEDLNSRLDQPLPMRRFRPSLVISGCRPFEEDTWRTIRIGSIECRVVKPCSRCVLTTVDPETGDKGHEPLRTLSTYRRAPDGKINFGQNVIHDAEGTIRVGDAVEVLEARS